MTPAEKERVVDLCYGCKLCEIKCPYTPHDGHEFQLDFPRLIIRGKSVNAREDGVKLRERILAHSPLAADSIRRHEGSIEITTRPDPRTGSTHRLFDPLDWIHAVTADIPDRGRHCVRYYGALANRAQSPKAFCEQQTPPAPDPAASGETTSDFVQRRRTSWARLIKRIFVQ